MRFAQFLRLDRGSNTVGFALIVPLLTSCFFAVIQIANLVNVQTTLSAVAKSAAREASRFDASLGDGNSKAAELLKLSGVTDHGLLNTYREQLNGITYVRVDISKTYEIPWLGWQLELFASGRSVDEKSL